MHAYNKAIASPCMAMEHVCLALKAHNKINIRLTTVFEVFLANITTVFYIMSLHL